MYNLVSKYKPAGDQPKAREELVKEIKEGKKSGSIRCNRYC